MDKEKQKAYDKKYNQEHREKRNAYSKKYYRDHKEEHNAYCKKWFQEHKEKQKIYKRKYYQEHKEELAAWGRNWRKRHKEKALKLFGNKCFICNLKREERRFYFHKKDGKWHRTNLYNLIVKNPEDWILLCNYCHIFVHGCMKYFGYSWDDIVIRLFVE